MPSAIGRASRSASALAPTATASSCRCSMLREYDVDPRRLRRKLRRGDAAHVQRAKSAGHLRARPSATSARRHRCAARARYLDCSRPRSAMDELAVKLGIDPVRAASHQRAASSTRVCAFRFSLASPQGMPDARGREVRLVAAQSASRRHEARRHDIGMGDGGVFVDRRTAGLLCLGRTARRRHGSGHFRLAGYRHRYLHGHGANGGGNARHRQPSA